MGRRQAVQSLIKQGLTQTAPGHKRRLNAKFGHVGSLYGVPVASIVKLLQAGIKQLGTAQVKVLIQQVSRAALVRVKKCTRQRREDRRPAQQAEQTIDQRILDVVHRLFRPVQMASDPALYR